MSFGAKYIWWLYVVGGLFGGICMQMAMPYGPVVVPQVGADASISALLTFYGLFNLQNSMYLFVFPVKMWVLLSLMGIYSLIEPSKKNFGGMVAGLLIYQLFKVRIIWFVQFMYILYFTRQTIKCNLIKSIYLKCIRIQPQEFIRFIPHNEMSLN